jgi:hypothetical protein
MRQRPPRVLHALTRRLCRAALRAVITGLVFAACFVAALSFMGVPVPGPGELLERFEGVSRLAEILS